MRIVKLIFNLYNFHSSQVHAMHPCVYTSVTATRTVQGVQTIKFLHCRMLQVYTVYCIIYNYYLSMYNKILRPRILRLQFNLNASFVQKVVFRAKL